MNVAKHNTPLWVGAALALTEVLGLTFMIAPRVALFAFLITSGAAGLLLFAAVCIGHFDNHNQP